MGFPPHPGSRTRSPAFTLTGTIVPFEFGAPGPTAITVASGRGLEVAEDGRKMPVAVFCSPSAFFAGRMSGKPHCLGLEPLDKDSVEEGLEGADVLECGGLKPVS